MSLPRSNEPPKTKHIFAIDSWCGMKRRKVWFSYKNKGVIIYSEKSKMIMFLEYDVFFKKAV